MENETKNNGLDLAKLVHNVIIPGTAMIISLGLSLGIVQNTHLRKYNTVKNIADTNRDGATSTEEWKEVYRAVGVEFSEPQPKELSDSELDKYLRSVYPKASSLSEIEQEMFGKSYEIFP